MSPRSVLHALIARSMEFILRIYSIIVRVTEQRNFEPRARSGNLAENLKAKSSKTKVTATDSSTLKEAIKEQILLQTKLLKPAPHQM